MMFGVSSCMVAWIVTSERSPLADYFLYHTAIPNIWAALHTVPYMIGLVIRPELLPEELVLYGLVSLQWMLVGYGISRVVYRG